MSLPVCRLACALGLVGLAVALAPARADDVEDVKEKLFQAKKEYDGEARKFRNAISELLDKREADARKAGNPKAADQAIAARDRFEKTGEPPADCPKALLAQAHAARTKLDRAYSAAVKDLVRLKEDAAAGAVEKEQQKFILDAALQFGKRTYLVALKHFDLKVPNGWFSNNGTINTTKIKKDGEFVPHSIFLHPPDKGTSQVKYALEGKWQVLHASVGAPTMPDNAQDPSAMTFEVLGDGKSLWRSEPVTKIDTFQACTVRVEKVKVLALQVHTPDKTMWTRAVWFEPVLIE